MKKIEKYLFVMMVVFSLILSNVDSYTISKASETNLFKGNGFNVYVSIDSEWDGHYSATITIENTGNEKIENWNLAFDSGDNIENIWNAKIKYHKNGQYKIGNAGWNQDIAPMESVSFGYIATFKKKTDIPSCFMINGKQSIISGENYKVDFTIENKWDDGAIINVTIENQTEKLISDWQLSFDANYNIENIWDAVVLSNGNNCYILKNADYNSIIQPHEKVRFGYKITGRYAEEDNIVLSEIIDEIDSEETEEIIGSINLSHKTILTNKEYKLWITAEINNKKINSNYSVELYMFKDRAWNFCDYLYDLGNLNTFGDEIKGDGTYSNFIKICESKTDNLRFKIVIKEGSEELDSKEVSVRVVSKIDEKSMKRYYQANLLLQEYVNEKIEKTKAEVDIVEIIDDVRGLLPFEEIKKITAVDKWTIKIEFQNGLITYIQMADDSDMELMRRGNGAQKKSEKEIVELGADIENEEIADDYVDEDIEYVGNEDFGEDMEDDYQEYDYVLSNNVLVWNPFDTEWGNNDETEVVQSIAGQSLYGLEVDKISDNNADIASLKKLSGYGLIVIATHGIEGKWLATGEIYSDALAHSMEMQSGELSVLIRGEISHCNTQMLYMVNSSWINRNVDNSFPNSIVINNSCSSLLTDDFSNVFLQKGVKTYYGYSGIITNDYVVIQTQSLLQNLINNEQSTQEAFEYSYDSQYDGEYFGIRGYGNILLPFGLMNGSFENGLGGWNKEGDGRSIVRLGGIMPTEGERMAIISTGLGYTKELGEINQFFCIPENATKLQFDWNFISEEFLEYIGSEYDDPFEVNLILKDENNRKHNLVSMSVNSIADDFNATESERGNLIHVSPDITFDRGDVWMTGWQKAEVDISAYAGENVCLIFSVKDAADSIYTTAVLLDNLNFDIGNISVGEPIEISEEFSDDTIRGLFGKDEKGKSYVFYDSDNFSKQATSERKRIKYNYGYKNISQVVMFDTSTEKEFVDGWNKMPSDKKIDKVSLLFHGTFYAIMIDSDNDENLTTSPSGKVSSEYYATYIRSLPKKRIGMINILTCNAGVLDAINYYDTITLKDEKGIKHTFRIKGNVAQAFLDSQDVDAVQAWDGSLSYTFNYPRLSRNQEHFRAKLKVLKDKRVCVPIRGTIVYNMLTDKTINKKPNKPYGLMKYTRNSDGKLTCKYTYRYKQKLILSVYSKKKTKTIIIKDLSESWNK